MTNEKEYTFWQSINGSEPERVVKSEKQLTQQDYDLFLGNIISEFNRCPERVKIEFLQKVYNDSKWK